MVRYESGKDLLQKTPDFYRAVTKDRLESKFNRAYRYVEVLYDGQNPYIEAIETNISHLLRVLKTNDWSLLRREPACYLGLANSIQDIEQLAASQLAAISGIRIDSDNSRLMPV